MRLGSCDFLLKPYEIEQLIRGIQTAMTRRQHKLQQKLAVQLLTTGLNLNHQPIDDTNSSTKHSVIVRDLILNLEDMTLVKDGKPISLTPMEFRLLTTMIKRPNHPFTFQELAENMHGQKSDLFQARDLLKSHLGRLRRKLGDLYIVNVRGVGYKFVDKT
jgi:DNA-binding response OmpR family regulator